MRLRNVMSVMKGRTLGDFPWGPSVLVTINPLLPQGFTKLTLKSTYDDVQQLMLDMPTTLWGSIQDTDIPENPLQAAQQASQANPTSPTASPTACGPAAPQDVTSIPAGSDPGSAAPDTGKHGHLKLFLVIFCVLVTIWSLKVAWSLRHDNPNAIQSKSLVVKIFQQIADTIDSAATGNQPTLPVQPGTPAPSSTAPSK
jgi:hypothetical protein